VFIAGAPFVFGTKKRAEAIAGAPFMVESLCILGVCLCNLLDGQGVPFCFSGSCFFKELHVVYICNFL